MIRTLVPVTMTITLFCATNVNAFEIRGRVVDSSTQSGLEKVNVSFVTLDGRTFDKAETGPNGEFRKDVPQANRQFRIAYEKSSGGPDGLGYEGHGRNAPVENNVTVKDVDTIALRPRRKESVSIKVGEKDEIVKGWLSYYLVTKEQSGLSKAIKYYSIDETSFKRGAGLVQLETGRPVESLTWAKVKD